MARRHFRKHNPASRKARAQRRRRAIGTIGAISAFLTFGLGPLAHAPKARAEGFDALIDQALTAITGSSGDLDGVSWAAPELGGLGAGATDAGEVAAANPAGAWLHALEQDWGALSQDVDTALGTLFNKFNHVAAPTVAMSQNLLVNGDFAIADPSESGYNGVTIPGWTTETGDPTVIAYDTPRNYPWTFKSPSPDLPFFFDFPQHAPPGTPAGDDNFAGGGPVGTSSISQTVNLTGAAGTPFELSADLGGQFLNPSYTSVQVTFLNADGDVLGTDALNPALVNADPNAVYGTDAINPFTVLDRLGFTGFEHRDITGTVPEGTTSAQVLTTFNDENHFLDDYNGAYAANESFTVGDPSLTAAPLTPPVSDVGHLDHVFVIYLEDEGNNSILGNPLDPFMNHLIKTEDFDMGYHSIDHPSNPNYIALVGGSDFGIDYDDPAGSITEPNLMQEWDKAGISWADYAENIPADTTITKSLIADGRTTPFEQYTYVYDNTPAYLTEHIHALSDLASALQNPSTFPDFAWVKPNVGDIPYGTFSADPHGASADPHGADAEGPISSFFGDLKSDFNDLKSAINTALNYISTEVFPTESSSQDKFLQYAITTIENSPTWTDPNEKDAIFITFDEDQNQPSLDIEHDNDDDNVPMIVIPNQGAVTEGGMRAGPFLTDADYNVYSLMATIEDALRPLGGTLAPLTDNDKYAEPMNAFWK